MSPLYYFDHAASAPRRDEVADAMARWQHGVVGNPSGSHRAAREARQAIEGARDEVARFVGAEPGGVIFTAGGTGVGPRDVTPEATMRAAERLVPGLGERMRAAGASANPHSILSRSQGACRGRTLILNLPGSPRGAVESFGVVADVLPHAIEILHGAGHEPAAGGGKV